MRKEHWALLSLALNIFQALIKLVGGLLTGSLSLIGDAVHSLSDALASLIAFLSIKFSEVKNERFPYGLYKLENIGAIVISFFLLFTAWEIANRALKGEIEINYEYLPVGIGITVVSLVSSLTLSFLERRAGKKLNSPTLIADSYHTLTDAFSSFLVLVSLASYYFGVNIERYVALAIALVITFTALQLLKEQVGAILDISADKETIEKIKKIILSFPEVSEVKRLLVRSAGGKLFIDAVITINTDDFVKSHRIADEIEKRITEEIPNVEMVFIHYEPCCVREKTSVAILTNDGKVARTFSDTKSILIFKEGEGNPVVVKMEGKSEECIAKELVRQGVDIVISGYHPKSNRAKWILHKSKVFVWETEKENPYEALAEVSQIKEKVS
ncbi:MAG: cation transporter [Aquificae bacterium]|nr:cation transporter [Aquificota bacterium]